MLIVSADDDEDFGIYGSLNSNDFLALSFFEVGEEMSFFDVEGGDGGGE